MDGWMGWMESWGEWWMVHALSSPLSLPSESALWLVGWASWFLTLWVLTWRSVCIVCMYVCTLVYVSSILLTNAHSLSLGRSVCMYVCVSEWIPSFLPSIFLLDWSRRCITGAVFLSRFSVCCQGWKASNIYNRIIFPRHRDNRVYVVCVLKGVFRSWRVYVVFGSWISHQLPTYVFEYRIGVFMGRIYHLLALWVGSYLSLTYLLVGRIYLSLTLLCGLYLSLFVRGLYYT